MKVQDEMAAREWLIEYLDKFFHYIDIPYFTIDTCMLIKMYQRIKETEK